MKYPSISVAALIGINTIAVSRVVSAAGEYLSPQKQAWSVRDLGIVIDHFLTPMLKTPLVDIAGLENQKVCIGKHTLGEVIGIIEPENTALLVDALKKAAKQFKFDQTKSELAEIVQKLMQQLTQQIEQAKTIADGFDSDTASATGARTTTGTRPGTPGVHTGGAPADTALGATAAPQTD